MLTKKALVLAAGLGLFAAAALPVQAYADSCTATATSKKLAGAAKTSFMKKCQTDAATSCDSQAADKKLAGAAKTSFTKKCVSDAVGS
jgi:psiF repeat